MGESEIFGQEIGGRVGKLLTVSTSGLVAG